MPGGEWGFTQQVSNQAVNPPPLATTLPNVIQSLLNQASQSQGDLRAAAVQQHIDYWNQVSPGQYFEHERYGAGWDVGYSDALTFFGYRVNHIPAGTVRNGGDRIGHVDAWMKRREREYTALQQQIAGPNVSTTYFWEFAQGLQRGIQDLQTVVGLQT